MEQKILAAIRDIAALGMSMLLVGQNARLALQAAQRGLRDGKRRDRLIGRSE
jgi:ABC-type branched-subunit amino acid transport system ATPase component